MLTINSTHWLGIVPGNRSKTFDFGGPKITELLHFQMRKMTMDHSVAYIQQARMSSGFENEIIDEIDV